MGAAAVTTPGNPDESISALTEGCARPGSWIDSIDLAERASRSSEINTPFTPQTHPMMPPRCHSRSHRADVEREAIWTWWIVWRRDRFRRRPPPASRSRYRRRQTPWPRSRSRRVANFRARPPDRARRPGLFQHKLCPQSEPVSARLSSLTLRCHPWQRQRSDAWRRERSQKKVTIYRQRPLARYF